MDFGMPFLLEHASIADAAALCKKLGLQFVELNMNFPPCGPDALDARQLLALQREYGVYFTLHLDENLNPLDFSAAVRKTYTDIALQAIALARDIGAPVVNMHWPRGVYITLPDRKVYLFQKYSEAYTRHTLAFRAACERALAGGDTLLCVENTNGFAPHEADVLDTLLACPQIGLTLDIGHSHCAADADMPFYQARLGRLRHMHAHDARGKSCHLPFGAGEIDIKARLALAKRAGARVVLEVKTVQALTDTAAARYTVV